MYRRLIQNHILTNLVFVLVVILGAMQYLSLPRQQDPSVNFNWVEIHTRFPGASAIDVEKRVTDVLEDAVQRVPDIRYSASNSRAGLSRIIVRFRDLDKREFDDHLTDLRREVQNKERELPAEADQSKFFAATSDNHEAAVLLLIVGQTFDDNLRLRARHVADALQRLPDVDRVGAFGMRDPELQVRFNPSKMQGLGIPPDALADTVSSYFRNVSAGSLRLGDQQWMVGLNGTDSNPAYLSNLPILSTAGEVPLRSVAHVVRGLDEPTELVEYQNHPAILLAVYKRSGANLLGLVDQVASFARESNKTREYTGARLILLNDQTEVTRNALAVMESNALIGLLLVLLATWIFLGFRNAFFSSLGIPFALAGTLLVIAALGQSLNVVVLLGLVISLGMLVDDAVVVVEAIHYRMVRGSPPLDAAVAALKEVAAPVTASVLTTIAAFIPLMLMPGVLGDYMRVAPLVVTAALLLSLLEAFWMLPSHAVAGLSQASYRDSRLTHLRSRMTRWLRNRYSRIVIGVLRRPRRVITGVLLVFALTGVILGTGLIRVDFFATDSARMFYINVDMPAGTSLEKTLATTQSIEHVARPFIRDNELRAIASYAGTQFGETNSVIDKNTGQVAVSLRPRVTGGRTVEQIIGAIRDSALRVPGPKNVTFHLIKTGPPTEPPVSIKLRGDDLNRLASAAHALETSMRSIAGIHDIHDDDVAGRMQLNLRLNPDAIVRSKLDPAKVIRDIQLLGDGRVVASMRDHGDKLDVRVLADRKSLGEINNFLDVPIDLPGGGTTSMDQLVQADMVQGRGNIRHQNFRRAVTVMAELDSSRTDTLTANRQIHALWDNQLAQRFPDVHINFSGEMDDIKASLNSLGIYFLFGLILIYIILSTQFRSYFQPMMVLVTIPTAFTGVVIGVAISGYPLSLYTLYGVVALAGIAVNSAIVFVSAANERVRGGMTTAQATVFAARRRVVPILITTVTTMAGLFSLAIGLAGQSNIWCPVASAIVWGLGVSTLLTLLITPLLYARFAPALRHGIDDVPLPVPLERRQGARERLWAILSSQGVDRRRYQDDLAAIAADNTLADAYRRGRQAMVKGDLLTAIKQFQHVADAGPDLVLANRAAAHAALALMYDTGWDQGYDARVRRFLTRALRRAPNAPDIVVLKRLYQNLRMDMEAEARYPVQTGNADESRKFHTRSV